MIQNTLSNEMSSICFITLHPNHVDALQHLNKIDRPRVLSKNKQDVPRNVKIEAPPQKVISDYFINLANW